MTALPEPTHAHDLAARQIISAAMTVHTALGPGLLESVYERCLASELESRGLSVSRQVSVPLRYRDQTIDAGFRLDLLVDELVVVEVKTVQELSSVHEAQILTYLKLSGHRLGLLINFNVARLKDGLRRFVSN